MVLALVSSLTAIALGRLGVPWLLAASELVRGIDFHEVLMEIMLSFLLFAGALHVDVRTLGKERGAVAAMAVAGTLLSTLLVAVGTYYVLPLFGIETQFIYALLFGALISPTDPIAVLGILKQAKISKNLEIKIVGESLFNDGIAVVVFASLYEVAIYGTDKATPAFIGELFLREALGGVVLGTVLGYAGFWAPAHH